MQEKIKQKNDSRKKPWSVSGSLPRPYNPHQYYHALALVSLENNIHVREKKKSPQECHTCLSSWSAKFCPRIFKTLVVICSWWLCMLDVRTCTTVICLSYRFCSGVELVAVGVKNCCHVFDQSSIEVKSDFERLQWYFRCPLCCGQ